VIGIWPEGGGSSSPPTYLYVHSRTGAEKIRVRAMSLGGGSHTR